MSRFQLEVCVAYSKSVRHHACRECRIYAARAFRTQCRRQPSHAHTHMHTVLLEDSMTFMLVPDESSMTAGDAVEAMSDSPSGDCAIPYQA